MDQSVTVLIPAYNEGHGIRQVVEGVRAAGPAWDVLVVDDGSRDDTAAEAEAAGARVVRHPYNIGNGAAIKTGLRHATGEIVVMLDADGQHDPADIPKLLEPMDTYDLVVGARTKDSDVSRFRSLGNAIFLAVARWISESDIQDLTSGFRAVRRDRALEFLPLYPNQYSYPTTMTLSFLKAGFFVHYVPLPGIGRRQGGTSRIRPFRDGMRFLTIIVKTVMLFDPLKAFLPAAFVLILSGTGFGMWQYSQFGAIRNASVILVVTGVLVLFFGLLASQNASLRR